MVFKEKKQRSTSELEHLRSVKSPALPEIRLCLPSHCMLEWLQNKPDFSLFKVIVKRLVLVVKVVWSQIGDIMWFSVKIQDSYYTSWIYFYSS